MKVKPRYGRLRAKLAISASSNNTAADLPPSSSTTDLNEPAQVCAIALPVSVEPVNPTMFTPGWATSASPASRDPGNTFITPGGNPACAAASAKI